MYIILFNIILFSAVGFFLYRIYSKTTSYPANSGFLYFERGGGLVGKNRLLGLWLTWPFVTIHLFEDSLLLNSGGKKVELKYSEITKVSLLYIPIIAEGIRIHHNNLSQPAFLRFWSLGKSKHLKKLLDDRLNKST